MMTSSKWHKRVSHQRGDVQKIKINQCVVSAGIPYRIRTGVAAVKGQCPRPLDERDVLETLDNRERRALQAGRRNFRRCAEPGRVQRLGGVRRAIAAARLPVRQASEQNRTLSQSRAHLRRQVNGRPHAAQSLVGRLSLPVMARRRCRPGRRYGGQ